MSWATMIDFVDGTTIDEGDLDPLVANINDLRNSMRVMRGKWIQKAGDSVNGITTTETTIADLNLDGVTVESGQRYMFFYNVYLNASVAGASWFFRVRKGTALSGAQVISTMFASVLAGLDDSKVFMLPWAATSTETTTYFLSVQRLAGSGDLDIRGDGQTAGCICRAGDSGTGIWTTVT